MNWAKILTLTLALSFGICVPEARADIQNQMTRFRLNTPVQVPGNRVLEPGTYWFKVLNTNQNVVVIYNANQTRVKAALLTIPIYDPNPTTKTQILAAEISRRNPELLVKWFYPGMDFGHEFVYSPHMERKIREEPTKNIVVNP